MHFEELIAVMFLGTFIDSVLLLICWVFFAKHYFVLCKFMSKSKDRSALHSLFTDNTAISYFNGKYLVTAVS